MTVCRSAAAIATCALALTACGRNEAYTGASSADSHAPGTTLATAPGTCDSYSAGTPGVVRTFCDGPAVVKLTLNGQDHVLKGGTCGLSAGVLTLNLGVVAGPDLGGPKPDLVQLSIPASGHFVTGTLTVNLGGKSHAFDNTTGDATPSGGGFEAIDPNDGTKVNVRFNC